MKKGKKSDKKENIWFNIFTFHLIFSFFTSSESTWAVCAQVLYHLKNFRMIHPGVWITWRIKSVSMKFIQGGSNLEFHGIRHFINILWDCDEVHLLLFDCWWVKTLKASFFSNHLKPFIIGHVAAAAKLLQSCLTLCDPTDGSPAGSPVPGILQARSLEWVAISFSNAWIHAKSLQSCPTLCNPMDRGHQAPLSIGLSRQEYWSGLSFPSPHNWS